MKSLLWEDFFLGSQAAPFATKVSSLSVLKTQPGVEVSWIHSKFPYFYNKHFIIIIIMLNLSKFTYS